KEGSSFIREFIDLFINSIVRRIKLPDNRISGNFFFQKSGPRIKLPVSASAGINSNSSVRTPKSTHKRRSEYLDQCNIINRYIHDLIYINGNLIQKKPGSTSTPPDRRMSRIGPNPKPGNSTR